MQKMRVAAGVGTIFGASLASRHACVAICCACRRLLRACGDAHDTCGQPCRRRCGRRVNVARMRGGGIRVCRCSWRRGPMLMSLCSRGMWSSCKANGRVLEATGLGPRAAKYHIALPNRRSEVVREDNVGAVGNGVHWRCERAAHGRTRLYSSRGMMSIGARRCHHCLQRTLCDCGCPLTASWPTAATGLNRRHPRARAIA